MTLWPSNSFKFPTQPYSLPKAINLLALKLHVGAYYKYGSMTCFVAFISFMAGAGAADFLVAGIAFMAVLAFGMAARQKQTTLQNV